MISSPLDNNAPANPRAKYIALVSNYKSHICTGLAGVQLICGLMTAISILPSCILAGIIQLICGLLVLAVESPALISPFVPQLKPFAVIFENRPAWQKCAAFALMFFVPFWIGCFGLFFLLGEICAFGIAAVYGLVIVGEKANMNDMAFQAGGAGGQTSQPYSPTSP